MLKTEIHKLGDDTTTLLMFREGPGPCLWLRLDVTGAMTREEQEEIEEAIRRLARKSLS